MMIFYLQVTASSGLIWCNVTLPRVSSAESVSACAARAAGAPPHLRQAREHGGRLERLVLLRQVRYINTWLGDLVMDDSRCQEDHQGVAWLGKKPVVSW